VSPPFQDQKHTHMGVFLLLEGRGCLIAKMQENTKTIPKRVQFWCSEDGGGAR